MCTWKPGPRCACHADLKLAASRAAYRAAHPDAPLPETLLGPQTVGAAMADWQLARGEARWAAYAVRVAQNHDDPDIRAAEVTKLSGYQDAAVGRALAAQEQIAGIRADRETTRTAHLAAHAPEVLADRAEDVTPAIPEGFSPAGFDGIGRHHTGGWRDEQGYDAAGYDASGHDRAGWTTGGRHRNGSRFDDAGRDQQGYARATGFDELGYHRVTQTQVGPTGETLEQVEARLAAARAPEAAAPVVVAPQRERLALYRQWNDRDHLVSDREAAELLGVDASGLSELTAAGSMPVAVEAGRGHPTMHELGSVLDLAGDLPEPPKRITRAMLQDHTAWRRSGEQDRVTAWREREAARNVAATTRVAA